MGIPMRTCRDSISWVTGKFSIRWLRYDCVSKARFTLGVKANVQPKSSIPIGAKVEIGPKGFTLGVKAEIEKIFSICPKY
jgi:hypothetical protein